MNRKYLVWNFLKAPEFDTKDEIKVKGYDSNSSTKVNIYYPGSMSRKGDRDSGKVKGGHAGGKSSSMESYAYALFYVRD